jgi:hypothetical protein
MTVAIAFMISLSALAASPFVAAWKIWRGVENDASYTQLLAGDLEREWNQATEQPLRLVGGTYALANSVSFYLNNKPLPISFTARTPARWATAAMHDQFGSALVCPAANVSCRSKMQQAASGRVVARRAHVRLQPRWCVFAGEPRDFIIDIVLPANHDPS